MIAMAQSQFYVIMKDGSGASFPESTVDSLTFNDDNGATIYGLGDLAKSISQLRKDVDSLKKIISLLTVDTSSYSHEYVDLGLPSGTLWATCNVGAKKSYQYGHYICWGETDQKSNYSLTGGKFYNYDLSTLKAEGVIDSHNNLTAEYDAATVLWGDDWRMPTTDEFDELIKYTTQSWVEENGTNGVLFTSKKNKNSIFLPCSGMIRDNVETMVGTRAYYLGATATDGSACSFYMSQGDEPGTLDIRTGATSRSHGRTIRAVRKTKPSNGSDIKDPADTDKDPADTDKDPADTDKDPADTAPTYIDLGLPSNTLWAKENLMVTAEYPAGTKFAWGETTTKLEFTEENYSLPLEQDQEEMFANGYLDNTGNLVAKYDAATVNLGNYWRLPTKAEFSELYEYCKMEIVDLTNGTQAVKVTGVNGNSIYFPAGFSYWTSTHSNLSRIVYANYFREDIINDPDEYVPLSVQCISPTSSHQGFLIRPVVSKR